MSLRDMYAKMKIKITGTGPTSDLAREESRRVYLLEKRKQMIETAKYKAKLEGKKKRCNYNASRPAKGLLRSGVQKTRDTLRNIANFTTVPSKPMFGPLVMGEKKKGKKKKSGSLFQDIEF